MSGKPLAAETSMPEKPEAQPDPDHVAAVIESVLEPLLERLHVELDHPLSVTVEVVRDAQLVQRIPAVGREDTTGQSGIVRIRFRETGDPKRRLFFLQARFESDARIPTFSGFTCRGSVETNEGRTVAAFNGWAVNREDSRWHPWL
ncbi:MAG: hypothetical protein ACYC7A_22505 [Thermoanaerobaculia bacterium]